MAESDQGEKTEDPTQQRREDFRKRGQVAQSKEFASVLTILAALASVFFLGKFLLIQMNEVFTQTFTTHLAQVARGDDILAAILFAGEKTAFMIIPFFIIFWIISFASQVLQVGFLYNEEAMKLKFDRLDPMQGLKRLFSIRSVVEGLKAVFKVIIVGSIAGLVIKSEMINVPQLIYYSIEQLFGYMGDVFFKIFGASAKG